jgi:hypothetical protein
LYVERQIVCPPDFVEQSGDPFKVGKVGANLDLILMPVRNHPSKFNPGEFELGFLRSRNCFVMAQRGFELERKV